MAEPRNHGIYDHLAHGRSLSPLPPPARPPRHGARYAAAAQGLRIHRHPRAPLRGTGWGDFYRTRARAWGLVGRFSRKRQVRGGAAREPADVGDLGGAHGDFCAVGDLGVDVDESRGVWKGVGWVAEEYSGFGGDLILVGDSEVVVCRLAIGGLSAQMFMRSTKLSATTKLSAEHETPPIANVLIAVVLLQFTNHNIFIQSLKFNRSDFLMRK